MSQAQQQMMMSVDKRIDNEFGKSIALLVVVLIFLAVVGMFKLSGGSPMEVMRSNATEIVLFTVVVYITIQLLGNGAIQYEEGGMEDDVEERVKTSRIIYFTIGIFLCLMVLIFLCGKIGVCSEKMSRVSSYSFRNFFGRSKRRKCR